MTNPSGLITESGSITTTNTIDVGVSQYEELAIDVDLTAFAGTSPTYQLIVSRKGMDGVYYPIYTGSAQSAAGQISLSIGRGMSTNVSFGTNLRIREVIGGTTPSITRSLSLIGK